MLYPIVCFLKYISNTQILQYVSKIIGYTYNENASSCLVLYTWDIEKLL